MTKNNNKGLDFASWVVNYTQKNPQSRQTISKWISHKDPTIDMVSSLRSLSKKEQTGLKKELKTSSQNTSQLSITTSAGVISEKKTKLQFKVFLKLLSFVDDIVVKKGQENDWVAHYTTKKIKIEELRSLSDRFISLSKVINNIPFENTHVKGFWGIYPNGIFTYGFLTQNDSYVIDEFKFSKSFFGWLRKLSDKITWELKKDFFDFDFENLGLLYTIKGCVDNLSLGEKDRIFDFSQSELIFGFKGIGLWRDDELDRESYQIIKEKIKEYLRLFSWKDRIQYKVSPHEYWIYVFLKIK